VWSIGWLCLRSAKHGRGNDQGTRQSSCACRPSLGSHHATPWRHRHLAGPPSPGTPSIAPFALACLPSLCETHTPSALRCSTGRVVQTVSTTLSTASVAHSQATPPSPLRPPYGWHDTCLSPAIIHSIGFCACMACRGPHFDGPSFWEGQLYVPSPTLHSPHSHGSKNMGTPLWHRDAGSPARRRGANPGTVAIASAPPSRDGSHGLPPQARLSARTAERR
jgi:hypothetical protein